MITYTLAVLGGIVGFSSQVGWIDLGLSVRRCGAALPSSATDFGAEEFKADGDVAVEQR